MEAAASYYVGKCVQPTSGQAGAGVEWGWGQSSRPRWRERKVCPATEQSRLLHWSGA